MPRRGGPTLGRALSSSLWWASLLLLDMGCIAAPDWDIWRVITQPTAPDASHCEPITIPLCKTDQIPYNTTTTMPHSLRRHDTQEEAGMEVHQFFPLVEIQCSPDLNLFLCSVYVPPCPVTPGNIVPPCRSLCLSAKAGCDTLMSIYGFQWPQFLSCDKFPDGSEDMCIGNGSSTAEPQDSLLTSNDTDVTGSSTQSQQNHTVIHNENKQRERESVNQTQQDQCENIRLPLCSDLPYTSTRLPNLLHHRTQEEATSMMHLLRVAIMTQCSPDLRLLVCAIIVPPCTHQQEERLPCRELCFSVNSGCAELMQMFGIQWPSTLDCNMLPSGHHERCIGANITDFSVVTEATANPEQFVIYEGESISTTELQPVPNKCERITIPTCQDLQYNDTIMPNAFNHSSQEEAQLELDQFLPLIESKCSTNLQLFLCRLFVPVCTPMETSLLPCRNLCLSVEAECGSAFYAHGSAQPVKCEDLDDELCLGSFESLAGELVPSTPMSVSPRSTTPLVIHQHVPEGGRCEYTTSNFCVDLYNTTIVPNLLEHISQEDAALEMHSFMPLTQIKCSSDILAFLCSVYIPPCTSLEQPVPPCRSFCYSAMDGCIDALNSFGFQWPEFLNCDRFPIDDGNEVCIDASLLQQSLNSDLDAVDDSTPLTTEQNTTPPPTVNTGLQISSKRCEDITAFHCLDIPYNSTLMPNLLNHMTQDVANMQLSRFYPLVKAQCSPNLQLFLCMVYIPVCTIIEKPIPPCRDLCLSARMGCEGLMIKFGFQWPADLACDHFPEDPSVELCVSY
ncbi:uncharacterized protein LOC121864967 [Homarus americanus]|uniref:Frizzled-2-like n=1 Tax=Homarus americanus TaxID=6706 RepID=A0A8J5K5U3_HOMAM|nr:uncharacterized protein LOC121864967 [Homarus americanus]KAG7170041.1 Frizzled-2-like [Homarus americanus]